MNGLDSPNQIAAQRLDELLAEKLPNYRIEIYPGGQLGGERDMIESVQLGTLDMTITAMTPLTNFVPGMGAGELAYLISMLEGLLGSGIVDIEMGNCKGLGEYRLLAAVAAGADEIDCGLLGMARSAGNCATELAAVTLKKEGYLPEVDIHKLLDYLEKELIPAMEAYHYHTAVNLNDLMLGYAGCHSNFLLMFEKVAAEERVPVRRLITEVSAVDRRNPSEKLLREAAGRIRRQLLSA